MTTFSGLTGPCFIGPSSGFNSLLEIRQGTRYKELKKCHTDPTHKFFKINRPIEVIMPSASVVDFSWTIYNDCIVTRDIRQALLNKGLTGIEFRKIRTFSTSGFELTNDLYELIPLGWGGFVHSDSEIVLSEYCKGCGRAVFSKVREGRMYFDIDAWDGTDFFRVWPLPALKCASPDFIDALKEIKPEGIKLISFEEWRPNLSGQLGPGLVREWVSGPRGLELERRVSNALKERYL